MLTFEDVRYIWGWVSAIAVWVAVDVALGGPERRWIKSLRPKEKKETKHE